MEINNYFLNWDSKTNFIYEVQTLGVIFCLQILACKKIVWLVWPDAGLKKSAQMFSNVA